MKFVLGILALLIVFAIVLPLLHLMIAVLVVVAGIIILMAAWKVLFRPAPTMGNRGGPPAIS